MAGRFLSGCFCGKEILPKIAALPAFSLIFSQLFTHTLGRRAIYKYKKFSFENFC
jgi:hypothetical protein